MYKNNVLKIKYFVPPEGAHIFKGVSDKRRSWRSSQSQIMCNINNMLRSGTFLTADLVRKFQTHYILQKSTSDSYIFCKISDQRPQTSQVLVTLFSKLVNMNEQWTIL